MARLTLKVDEGELVGIFLTETGLGKIGICFSIRRMEPAASPLSATSSATLSIRFRVLWEWFRGHAVFPLLLACAGSALLSGVILVVRKALTGQGRLMFLPFNLLLAFLPLAFLLLFERSRKRSHAVICGVLWLLLFPNAPYMLTDLVHFDRRLGPASWLDLMAILAAAWSALLGGLITLRFMQERVQLHHSRRAGHSFVLTILFLSSMGIYVGRFLRFHSIDVFHQPVALVSRTASHFFSPGVDPMAWPFTLAVFGLLCCMYYSLLAFTHAVGRPLSTPAGE